MFSDITFLEQRTDDIEVLYPGDSSDHWELRGLQLSAGRLGASTMAVSLPDMVLSWFRCNASIHVQECLHGKVLGMAFALEAPVPVKWFGRTLDLNQTLFYAPEQDHDYVLPKNLHSFGILVSSRLRRQMGWRTPPSPLLGLDRSELMQFHRLASGIAHRIRQGGVDREEALLFQERLTLQLDRLMEPVFDGHEPPAGPHRHYWIVNRALAVFESLLQPHSGFSAAKLCEELGVSRRTLYRAFHNCLGIGPREYFMRLKLRAFRHRLLEHERPAGAITQAALTVGFSHLGRLSRQYLEHYGELPKETVRRWL